MDKDNIYQEYGEFFKKFLLNLTNDSHSAEELTQETFYQAIKSIGNFHDNGKAKKLPHGYVPSQKTFGCKR